LHSAIFGTGKKLHKVNIYLSLIFLLISNLTSWLRLHQFLGTCLPQ
jgi:hypothetical protein